MKGYFAFPETPTLNNLIVILHQCHIQDTWGFCWGDLTILQRCIRSILQPQVTGLPYREAGAFPNDSKLHRILELLGVMSTLLLF